MPVETDVQDELLFNVPTGRKPAAAFAAIKKQGALADALLVVSQLNQGKFMRGVPEIPLVDSFKAACRPLTDTCWTLPSVRAMSPFFWCRSGIVQA